MIIVQQFDAQFSLARGNCDIVFTPCYIIDKGKLRKQNVEDGEPELEKFFDDERQYKFNHIADYERVGINCDKLKKAMEAAATVA
jgi:hypothetical protein